MADKKFFDRLKDMFSSDVIRIKDEDGNIKVADTDERQITNLSSVRDRYTRVQRTSYEMSNGAQSMAYQQVRRELFRDYDAMDNDPIINSALDIYASDSATQNEFGEILRITSPHDDVKEKLYKLFYDTLNIEFNIQPLVRNLCKYGDFFWSLEIDTNDGIINVYPQSVYNTERIEGSDRSNPNYVKFKVENDPLEKNEYENFEMAHFRLFADTNWLPYGKPMIENARRLWKQLNLMIDAMLIHRIMRAPEKRLFKIDIGNINPQEVDSYMQRIINKMKKVPFIDKRTGDYNLKYNMQNLTEDFFMPVRGSDSGTQIDTVGGLEGITIEDIEFLQARMFAALKIPKSFLGYEEEVSGKATLAAEDVRFTRTVEGIQRVVLSELKKIAIIHLYSVGVPEEQLLDFDMELTVPSTIAEQEKINLWSEKVSLARDMMDLQLISKEWIYKNIFKFSDEDIKKSKIELVKDMKDKFRYYSIEQDGNDPAKPQETEDSPQPNTDGGENNPDKGGRPKEGNTYGKDKDALGRDPLGDKERTSALKKEARYYKNKYNLDNLKSNKGLLSEGNILPDDDDENE